MNTITRKFRTEYNRFRHDFDINLTAAVCKIIFICNKNISQFQRKTITSLATPSTGTPRFNIQFACCYIHPSKSPKLECYNRNILLLICYAK